MTGLLGFFGLATRLDNRIYDLALHSRTPPAPSDVVVVTIDRSSLFELGRFPWSRRLRARLIDRLNEARAAGVAFDIALRRARLGESLRGRGVRQGDPVPMGRSSCRCSPTCASAASYRGDPPPATADQDQVGLGHVELEVDPDGVVRKIRPTTGLPSNQRPYLVAALLERAVKSGGYRADPRPAAPDPCCSTSWTLIPFSARTASTA
ncbi:MAG: CHASE2 domain-containing protein [Geminicoccaceae bacterium]